MLRVSLSSGHHARTTRAVAAVALAAGSLAGLLLAPPAPAAFAQVAECPLVSRADVERIYSRGSLHVGVENRFEADEGSSAVIEQTQCEFQFAENPLEGSATATLTRGAFNLSDSSRYSALFDQQSGSRPVEGLGDRAVMRIIRLEELPPVIAQLDVRVGNDMLSTTIRLRAAEISDEGVAAGLRSVMEQMLAAYAPTAAPAASPATAPAAPPATDTPPSEEEPAE